MEREGEEGFGYREVEGAQAWGLCAPVLLNINSYALAFHMLAEAAGLSCHMVEEEYSIFDRDMNYWNLYYLTGERF